MICSETQGLPILSLLELIKELIGSYSFYPSNTLYIYNVCSLLVLLLLFYVNLFKERFFVAPFWAKRVQRYGKFSVRANISRKIFNKSCIFSFLLTNIKWFTHRKGLLCNYIVVFWWPYAIFFIPLHSERRNRFE